MIEKTRKKQHCPWLQNFCTPMVRTVIFTNLMLLISTCLFAQANCDPPTSHEGTVNLAFNCEMMGTPRDGRAWNLLVTPNHTYTLMICDPNYIAGGSQPYFELWDGLNGLFVDASTFANGCASLTFSPCTGTTDYSLFLHTQHGTNFCNADNSLYEASATCTPITYTCPASNAHIKLPITDDNACCYNGLMPLPDFSGIECLESATLLLEYTDCNDVAVSQSVTLPAPDNAAMVNLPLVANSQNIRYTITVGGVSETCDYPVTVTKTMTCVTELNVALDSYCNVDNSAIINGQTCGGDSYDVTFTVNGAEVPALTSAYFGFSNIQAVTTAPNGNTCSTTIKLMDNLAPKFDSCPANMTLTCGQSIDTLVTGMATATDCSEIVGEVTFVDSSIDGADCGKIITRTFFATDSNGQTGTCQQIITLEPIVYDDIMPPSHYIDLDQTGSNEMILSCTDYPISTPPGIDVTGGLEVDGLVLSEGMVCHFLVKITDEITPICGGAYDIFRTFKITNWCDATADPYIFEQIIKVKDKDGPVGTAGAVSSANASNDCTNTVTVETASFVDGCSPITSGNYVVTLSGSGTSFTATALGTAATFSNVPYGEFNVTWCAQDECANQGCVSSSLTIVDETAPVAFCENRQITLTAATNFEFEFCAELLDDGSIDNCGNNVDVLIKNAADASAVFTECVDLSCSNTDAPITMILQATDDVGNSSTVSCTVTVVTGTPVCPTFSTVEINCNEDPTMATGWGEFAYDLASDCTVTDFSVIDTIDITNVCGPTEVLQTFTSAMTGLECTQPIRISPLVWDFASFVQPVDVTIDCIGVADVADIQDSEIAAVDSMGLLDIDRSDLCYTNQVYVAVLPKMFISEDECETIILKTYKVIDQCLFAGNLATPQIGEAGYYTFSQKITVSDNSAPAFDATPADITVDCTFQLPTLPTASDACGSAIVATTVDPDLGEVDAAGNFNAQPGTYTVSYTATDLCDNTAIAPITVTVQDMTAPELTCIPNAVFNLGADCTVTIMGTAVGTATDECDDGVLPIFIDIITDPATPPTTVPTEESVVINADNFPADGILNLQIRTVDASGNGATVTCSVNVIDDGNCLCGEGFTFNVVTDASSPNCNNEATLTNVMFDGVAIDAADYTITWNENTTCGNSLNCSFDDPGDYSVSLILDMDGNLNTCPATQDFTIVNIIEIGANSTNVCESGITVTSVNFNFSNASALVGNIEILDASENNLTDDTGMFICTDLAIGEVCPNQPTGDYIARVTFDNGCVQDKSVEVECEFVLTRIGGLITNEGGDQVDDVTVKISDAIDAIITDETGEYLFEDASLGNNYTVTPKKNIDPLNGVTTFDLVLISQHILGVSLLDSPYKLIAADANNTGSITTLDLVKIQRLILGLDTDFAPLDSWCFVDGDFVFTNPANPFQTTIPNIYPINGLSEDMLDVDFVGVKIGDVNGTAIANHSLQNAVRTNGTLDFEIQNQQYDRGETFEVDFTSQSFESLLGYQFTFQFDEDAMEFVEIKSGQLEQLSEENFGLSKVDKGLITSSWFNHQATTLKSDDVIFTMVFKAKEAGELSNVFEITSGITSNEIYRSQNTSVETLAVNLIVNGMIDTTKEVTLFQNSPNPFNESTNIQFYLPEADQATILIFDYSGKLVHEINRRFEKGMNEVSIDKATLQTTGVLFYQLETQQFTATKKMLLVE